MLRSIAAILSLATLGGCMAQKPTLAQVVESERLPLAGCDAVAAAHLAGKPANAQTLAQARSLSQASEVRLIRPDDAVAMDYRSGRLNLDLDAKGRIVRLHCG